MSLSKNVFTILVASAFGFGCVEFLLSQTSFLQKSLGVHQSRVDAGLELHDHEHHFCYGPTDRLRFDEELVGTEHPNQQYFEYRNDGVSLHTYNDHGLRVSIKEAALRDNVVVLGDSFARGTLADDTETIPSFLTKWANGPVFYNFGIGGHGPSQHLINYQRHSSLHPHDYVVLLYYLGNDAQNERDLPAQLLRAKEAYDQSLGSSGNSQNSFKAKMKAILERFNTGRLLVQARRRMEDVYEGSLQNSSAPHDTAALIKYPLGQILDAVNSGGKQLSVVTIPSREVYDETNFPAPQVASQKEMMRLQKEIIEEFSRQHDIPVLHLDEAFKRQEIDFKEIYGWPDAHFNELGYYISAIEIGGFLSESYGLSFTLEDTYINETQYSPKTATCPVE